MPDNGTKPEASQQIPQVLLLTVPTNPKATPSDVMSTVKTQRSTARIRSHPQKWQNTQLPRCVAPETSGRKTFRPQFPGGPSRFLWTNGNSEKCSRYIRIVSNGFLKLAPGFRLLLTSIKPASRSNPSSSAIGRLSPPFLSLSGLLFSQS